MKTRLSFLALALAVVAAVFVTTTVQPWAAELSPTGELKIGTASLGTEALDPSLNSITDVKLSLFPMFDSVVGAAPDGRLSKDHGLARDWEVKHYNDRSTYTLLLRKGVTFHDGVEATAEDVKFSLEYMMRPASRASGVGDIRGLINRMEVPEPYKVVIHTSHPYGILLESILSPLTGGLGLVLPKHYIEKRGEAYFNRNPIGTGAYKFKERVVGSQLTLEAWDRPHWLYGMPKYKQITFLIAPEEATRIAMLKRGELDVADVSRERLKEVNDFNVFRKKDEVMVQLRFLQFGPDDIYIRDRRVREALSLAIDREAIVKHIFMGMGRVTGDAIRYGTRALGYRPLPIPKHDPKKARSLMEEAIREKGWDKVRITYAAIARPGTPELPLMGEAIVGMWKEAFGELLDIKYWPTDYGTVRKHRSKKDLPNGIWGHTTTNRYVGGWGGAFNPKSRDSVFFENKGAPYIDRKVLAMLDRWERILDMQEFGRVQYEIAQYVADNYYFISIANLDRLVIANPAKIKKWDLGAHEFDINLPDLFKGK